MKENLDLLIEEKRKKRCEFATFISTIDKQLSPKEKKLSIHQGNDFIYVYNTFFDKHYEWCLKEILPLSTAGTPETASTFSWCYLCVNDTDKTELNIG